MQTKTNTLLTLYLLLLLSVIIIFIGIPLSLNSDQANGFLTFRSFLIGTTFNYQSSPDVNSINQDCTYWQSWWSPGQYAVPGIVSWIFQISIANATLIVVALFSTLGLFGFYKLYQHYGFSKRIALISICIICSQRYFLMPFSIYNGGEVLLFGFAPWTLFLFDKWFDLKSYPTLLILCVLGIFFKLTFFIVLISILIYLAVKRISNLENINTKKNITNINFIFRLFFTIAFTVTLVIINNKLGDGHSPSKTTGWNPRPMDFLIPLSASIVSGFGIDEVITKFIDFKITKSGWYSIDGIYFKHAELFYIPFALLTIVLIYHFLKNKYPYLEKYLQLIIVFNIIYCCVFTYLYTFNAAVSYESRHFRILGLLVIPLIVTVLKYLLENNKHWKKLISISLISIIVLFSCYGIIGFINRKNQLQQNCVVSRTGFIQSAGSQKLITRLKILDQNTDPKTTMFYCYSANLAIEIYKNRVLYFDDDFTEKTEIEKRIIKGKVPNLFIILPLTFEINGKATLIKNSFVNYKKFDSIFNDGKFEILYSKP